MVYEMDKKWLLMYKKAKEYYEKNGNLIVYSANGNEEDRELYDWLMNQRLRYYKGLLNRDKIVLLELLHIEWNVYDYCFSDVCNLGKFCRQSVPGAASYSEIEEKYNVDNLNNKQIQWLMMYESARGYYLIHGNLCIPNMYKDIYLPDRNGEKLYNWILTQRQNYRREKLSQDRIKLLEEIGMIWNADTYKTNNSWRREVIQITALKLTEEEWLDICKYKDVFEDISLEWLYMYGVAKKYYNYYHTLYVPSSGNGLYSSDALAKRLYTWLLRQKGLYSIGDLSQDKINLLEELDINWEVAERYNNKYRPR